MTLFTCGPVQMYSRTATIRDKGYIHFRTKEYGEMVKSTLKRLSHLMGNHTEFGTIYLACSGTGAMEATIENCMLANDKALVINGGGFGHRFCEMLEYHNISYDSVDLKWNETLTAEHLKPFESKGYTTLFVNINETTSGQLYDKQLLSDFAKRNNMYFIVDAIASFLADEYDMEKYGIDVTIISSQKGLCCSPGCAILSFSQRMIDKIQANDTKRSSLYFDYRDYLNNIDRGQTPYTPPVLVMYEIQDMLNMIEEEGGLNARLATIKEKGEYFRKKVKEIGLTVPDYPVSNMLTPVWFEDISAYDVIQVLKDKYDIYVNPCGGELADKLLRVSHLGDTNLADIDNLIDKLLLSIEEVKKQKELVC